jgi:hypothetical protein
MQPGESNRKQKICQEYFREKNMNQEQQRGVKKRTAKEIME